MSLLLVAMPSVPSSGLAPRRKGREMKRRIIEKERKMVSPYLPLFPPIHSCLPKYDAAETMCVLSRDNTFPTLSFGRIKLALHPGKKPSKAANREKDYIAFMLVVFNCFHCSSLSLFFSPLLLN